MRSLIPPPGLTTDQWSNWLRRNLSAAELTILRLLISVEPEPLTMSSLVSYLDPDEQPQGYELIHSLHRRGYVAFPAQGMVALAPSMYPLPDIGGAP